MVSSHPPTTDCFLRVPSFYQSLPSRARAHAQGANSKWGRSVGLTLSVLMVPKDPVGKNRWWYSQRLWVDFLLSTIPFILFEILTCLPPKVLLSPSCRALILVLQMLAETNGFLQLHTICWGSQGITHHSSLSSWGGNHCLINKSCSASWGRGSKGKAYLTVSAAPLIVFFSFSSNSVLESPFGKP